MKIRHLVADARDCSGPLDDPDALLELLRAAASAVGAREHGATTARFVPHGVTAVLILAESHIVASTWPEHRLVLVEILLCNDDMDPADAWEVLRAGLGSTDCDVSEVVRGIHP